MTDSHLDNPFFGLLLYSDSGSFYGSMQVLRRALEAISATPPAHLELRGLPGMGKTTLLRYLANPDGALKKNRAWLQGRFSEESDHIFPILVNFKVIPSELHPLQYVYLRMQEEYRIFRSRLAGEHLIQLPDLEPADEHDAVEMITRALERSFQSLNLHGIRPVLLLDDFDLAYQKMGPAQITIMRPWRTWVCFILCMDRALGLEAASSPFFTGINMIRFGGLTKDEAERILDEPAQLNGHRFPVEDKQFLLKEAGQHPLLLIVSAKMLWDTRAAIGILDQPELPLNDLEKGVLREKLLNELRQFFTLYTDKDWMTPNERMVLKMIADEKEKQLSKEYYDELALLDRKGLIVIGPDRQYKLFSELFASYLMSESAPKSEEKRPDLSETESKLYDLLRQHLDQGCKFEEIGNYLWEHNQVSPKENKRRVQVVVSRLRKKLKESTNQDIISVREEGYRLIETS